MSSATSPWKFPATIEPKHAAELSKRGISAEFAIAAGVRSIADNEARTIGFAASLPHDQNKQGLQGICFSYCDLATRAEVSWRLKPDQKFSLNGSAAKYLSRAGDQVRAYYPHTTTPEHAKDPKINLVLTEGEYKTLAIAEKIIPIASRPTCVIGLQGVNGAWHRDKTTVTRPDGTKETKKEGAPHLIDDLAAWDWKKRVVYIVFDSDLATKKNAEEFKRSQRSGAWGAEYTLAQLLRAQGAEVRIVVLPPKLDGAKYGSDDYIVERGAHEFLKLIYNNWTPERNPDEVLYHEKTAAIRFETSVEFVAAAKDRTLFVIDQVIPSPGIAMIAGASGLGKSAIALNACYSVASGGKFLGRFQCQKAKVLYIQTELSRTLLAERIRSVGICENLMIWTPGDSAALNWWEADGFQKRRETGRREVFMGLVDQIKSHGIGFVVFDPLSDFHTFPQSDPEGARHMMSLFRYLANVCNCGVMVVHHHKKIGRNLSNYEGTDDFFGSMFLGAKIDTGMSMYAYTRTDGTSRYKLKFSKQRCSAALPDQEINRIAQNDFFRWEAEDWKDDRETKIKEAGEVFIDYLGDHPAGVTYEQGTMDLRWSKDRWYRTAKQAGKRVSKIGNLYFLKQEKDDENGE